MLSHNSRVYTIRHCTSGHTAAWKSLGPAAARRVRYRGSLRQQIREPSQARATTKNLQSPDLRRFCINRLAGRQSPNETPLELFSTAEDDNDSGSCEEDSMADSPDIRVYPRSLTDNLTADSSNSYKRSRKIECQNKYKATIRDTSKNHIPKKQGQHKL